MRYISHALIFLLAVPALVAAQTFPSKPIRIIATATVGGGVDASARMVAQGLQETLGQPGVVGIARARGAPWAATSSPSQSLTGTLCLPFRSATRSCRTRTRIYRSIPSVISFR